MKNCLFLHLSHLRLSCRRTSSRRLRKRFLREWLRRKRLLREWFLRELLLRHWLLRQCLLRPPHTLPLLHRNPRNASLRPRDPLLPDTFPLNLSPRRPIPRPRDSCLIQIRKLGKSPRTAKPAIRRPIPLIRPPPLSNTKLTPIRRSLLLLSRLDNLLVPDLLPILAILRFSGFLSLELSVGADFSEFAFRTEIENYACFSWDGTD